MATFAAPEDALNERLDDFGQTINVAARVHGLADAGEIVLSQEVFEAAAVRALLEAHDVVEQTARVKGVSRALPVLCVRRA
jgi:class 3 adenylate cyclase